MGNFEKPKTMSELVVHQKTVKQFSAISVNGQMVQSSHLVHLSLTAPFYGIAQRTVQRRVY